MTITLLSAVNIYALIGGIVGGLLVLGIASWPISNLIASKYVYLHHLKRGSNDNWSRGRASCDDANILAMYAAGMAWHDANVSCKTDVHITNNGLNLYGEYYDLGNDKCVMIMSGRTESLEYGYYFAIPYAKVGYNVLVVDPRAHGLSDGEYNTIGFEESKDALAWTAYIHDNFGINSIILHGICIGSAGALYALTSNDCPDYVKGMVAEGMFANFGESMKEHLIEKKKPVFMLNDMIDLWMKHYTGHSMKFGPIDVIDKLNKPLLMLHSKEDLYSLPALAQKLYDKAGGEHKEIVWFDHGRHSMLRITDTAKYDETIAQFVTKNF
ncbi:MAG: alpha/beta fold hydrolase [Clostridiales bacterium]|nr:alpha/beta fold hydrolase [Clostridiales bacterium]